MRAGEKASAQAQIDAIDEAQLSDIHLLPFLAWFDVAQGQLDAAYQKLEQYSQVAPLWGRGAARSARFASVVSARVRPTNTR